jgi:hypothetical protein
MVALAKRLDKYALEMRAITGRDATIAESVQRKARDVELRGTQDALGARSASLERVQTA